VILPNDNPHQAENRKHPLPRGAYTATIDNAPVRLLVASHGLILGAPEEKGYVLGSIYGDRIQCTIASPPGRDDGIEARSIDGRYVIDADGNLVVTGEHGTTIFVRRAAA